ncbi:MAG: hypothetical protein GC184_12770 [Rhizobiales bacterium]|nr:hypothetical protein [Hyphomicrobiales bacterium]
MPDGKDLNPRFSEVFPTKLLSFDVLCSSNSHKRNRALCRKAAEKEFTGILWQNVANPWAACGPFECGVYTHLHESLTSFVASARLAVGATLCFLAPNKFMARKQANLLYQGRLKDELKSWGKACGL